MAAIRGENEGTGAALPLIEQSQPGGRYGLVTDGVDVTCAGSAGILGPLPVDVLPYDTFFPDPVMAENHVIDGAISEKFGHNTMSFNFATVSTDNLADMSAL